MYLEREVLTLLLHNIVVPAEVQDIHKCHTRVPAISTRTGCNAVHIRYLHYKMNALAVLSDDSDLQLKRKVTCGQ